MHDHGHEGGRHAVADAVGDEQAKMILIEPDDVVEVARDVVGGAPHGRTLDAMQWLQRPGQELALHDRRELQLIVHLGHLTAQAPAEAIGEGGLVASSRTARCRWETACSTPASTAGSSSASSTSAPAYAYQRRSRRPVVQDDGRDTVAPRARQAAS